MRPADLMGKRSSEQSMESARSSQSRPSIPRRASTQQFAPSRLGFSQLLVKIEWGVASMERVAGNSVKAPQAELDLAEDFDTARVWLEQLTQRKDKSMLKGVFEGDAVEQLAHLEGLCYKVELKVSNDQRRLDLLQRIGACNEVLADLGYAEQLREAKRRELFVIAEHTEKSPVDAVVPHLTDAALFGNQAMAYEKVSDFASAAETYGRATRSLRAAITVCRAVVKLKASIGAPESLLENDLKQLQRLESQTSSRIEHLKSLEPGATPIPMEEQIEAVDLSIHQDFWMQKKMMHMYGLGIIAAVGIGGVLCMPGPFGFALLTGATVAGAVVATFVRGDEGESGPEGLKQALANIADSAEEVGRQVSGEFTQLVDGISKEVAKVAVAVSPQGPGEKVFVAVTA